MEKVNYWHSEKLPVLLLRVVEQAVAATFLSS
jgi:hypothetical protein